MYFSNFPKIFYDFPQDATSTNLQILTDITTNVRIKKEILENITIYDEYDMLEGETPEIVAEKVYGNPEYHWIIMIANQRYDYLKDFPMSSLELDEYTKTKYGEDYIYNVHHYERDGLISEAIATLKVPSLALQQMKVNDFILNLPYANGRINSIDITTSTVNLLMDFGRFDANIVVALSGIRIDPTTLEPVFAPILNFTIGTNSFNVNSNYTPITNYEYEVAENEKKRRIKLISRELTDQIIREFRSLVRT